MPWSPPQASPLHISAHSFLYLQRYMHAGLLGMCLVAALVQDFAYDMIPDKFAAKQGTDVSVAISSVATYRGGPA